MAEFNAAPGTGVLGLATFAARGAPPAQCPAVWVNTPVLGGAEAAVCEVWRAAQPLEAGSLGRIQYTRGADVLFGCISLHERPDAAVTGERTPLYETTEQAYREIYRALDALGYPHLVRIWNYIPQINRETHGLERYRQFNSARQNAMLAAGRPVTGNVSAACALGAAAGTALVVYFLASQHAPTSIENPRQVSAYHYPPEYGARSPVFSRAAVHREADGMTLFISGTASIVGHQTIHAGDPAAQTRETLTNIEALLEETNRVTGSERFRLDALACKVYVRHPADLPLIQAELRAVLGATARVVYLQADICRHDLAVEIEAAARVSLPTKAHSTTRRSAAEHSV